MPLKQIIQIATIALDAGLIGCIIYHLGFTRGWCRGRHDLRDTISEGLDSMIASGKIIVMVRKDQLEKAGIKVPEDDSEDK